MIPTFRKTLTFEAHTDNKPSLSMVHSLGGTKRSKFIDLRHCYIQKKIKNHKINYTHVRSSNIKADICIKPLTRAKFKSLREMLGVRDWSNLGMGGLWEQLS